jgi:hypothetical protein
MGPINPDYAPLFWEKFSQGFGLPAHVAIWSRVKGPKNETFLISTGYGPLWNFLKNILPKKKKDLRK